MKCARVRKKKVRLAPLRFERKLWGFAEFLRCLTPFLRRSRVSFAPIG